MTFPQHMLKDKQPLRMIWKLLYFSIVIYGHFCNSKGVVLRVSGPTKLSPVLVDVTKQKQLPHQYLRQKDYKVRGMLVHVILQQREKLLRVFLEPLFRPLVLHFFHKKKKRNELIFLNGFQISIYGRCRNVESLFIVGMKNYGAWSLLITQTRRKGTFL